MPLCGNVLRGERVIDVGLLLRGQRFVTASVNYLSNSLVRSMLEQVLFLRPSHASKRRRLSLGLAFDTTAENKNNNISKNGRVATTDSRGGRW